MTSYHKKGLSTPAGFLSIDCTEKIDEMQTIVKNIRDRVATRTHIEMERYFDTQKPGLTTRRGERKMMSLPGTPTRGARSGDRLHTHLVSKNPSPVHDTLPSSPLLADRFLSRPRISKRKAVVKGLRHIRTFLPPVQKTLDYRDKLIRDSLVLLEMRRKVSSYLLKDSEMAHEFYNSHKRV